MPVYRTYQYASSSTGTQCSKMLVLTGCNEQNVGEVFAIVATLYKSGTSTILSLFGSQEELFPILSSLALFILSLYWSISNPRSLGDYAWRRDLEVESLLLEQEKVRNLWLK